MRQGLDQQVLSIRNVSKRYEIYNKPADRLKQFVLPRLQRSVLPASASRDYFKEFWALKDVSFDLDRGEALGILGRNGAGKSTLLQIIAGTLAPTTGSLETRGKIAALLELGSGFSPEFTGKENVRLNAALLGLTGEEIDEKYQQIVDFAGIGDFIDQPVKTYSTGMMLRLAFAVQTAVEPELLIVDEALAVGDARFQKKCYDRLEDLLSRGTTILFVTHDTGAVVRLCSRAIVLEEGRIHADGAPSVVARQYHRLLFEGSAAAPTEDLPHQVVTASARPDEPAVSGNTQEGRPDPVDARNAASTREVRYGSRDAEIYEIGIRKVSGETTRLVEVHQVYELFFKLRFNATVEHPLGYGFIISNARGIEVFATKAGLYKKSLPPSSEGAVFECRFRAALPMVPGAYLLSAAIAYDAGDRAGEFLDCRFDAAEFQVVGTTRSFTTCVVDLNGELSHAQLRAYQSHERGDGKWA